MNKVPSLASGTMVCSNWYNNEPYSESFQAVIVDFTFCQ